MKHLFVDYELALKLKEKGFNENYLAYYYPANYEEWGDELNKYEFKTVELRITQEVSGCDIFKVIPAPLYQQVIDWFRGHHKIWICETPYRGWTVYYTPTNEIPKECIASSLFIEEAIKEAIKLI